MHHRYTYDGGQPGNPTSANVAVHIAPGAVTTIVVNALRPAEGVSATLSPATGRMETFVSPSLSAFFGRPTTMRAYVEPPRGYARRVAAMRQCTSWAVTARPATICRVRRPPGRARLGTPAGRS